MTSIAVPAEDAGVLARMERVQVDPEALYDAEEAAIIIGIRGSKENRRNQMYAMPTAILPQHRVGPSGGRIRWLGRDLLAYREGKRQVG